MLVDSHAHLEFDAFDGDREAMLKRAKEAGVKAIVSIGTRVDNWDAILRIARQNPFVFMTVGVHPCDVSSDVLGSLKEKLQHYLALPQVVGVGETGLDYYHEPFDKELQKAFFRVQIEVARAFDVPIVVHSRGAEEDTVSLLEEAFGQGDVRVVLHCFSGSYEMAKACAALGCYFSASGILTFKNAEEVRQVFQMLPEDKILVETDAPYLAPSPYRGKRNEPAYVVETAKRLGDIRGLSFEAIAALTTTNFQRLFSRVDCL